MKIKLTLFSCLVLLAVSGVGNAIVFSDDFNSGIINYNSIGHWSNKTATTSIDNTEYASGTANYWVDYYSSITKTGINPSNGYWSIDFNTSAGYEGDADLPLADYMFRSNSSSSLDPYVWDGSHQIYLKDPGTSMNICGRGFTYSCFRFENLPGMSYTSWVRVNISKYGTNYIIVVSNKTAILNTQISPITANLTNEDRITLSVRVAGGYTTISGFDNVITNLSAPSAIPTNLSGTTGNFFINWTFNAGLYSDQTEVYIDNSLVQNSSALFYNGTYSAHASKTISLRGYNSTYHIYSGWNNLTTTIPNNIITLSNISSSYIILSKYTLDIYPTYSDIDGDAGLFQKNFSQGTINSTTGEAHWTPTLADNGTYNFKINVSDGYSAVDTKDFTVTVLDLKAIDLTASRITAKTITWAWTNPVSGYFLCTELYLDGVYKSCDSSTSAYIFNLVPDTQHTISLRAKGGGGEFYSYTNHTETTLASSTAPTVEAFYPLTWFSPNIGQSIPVQVNYTSSLVPLKNISIEIRTKDENVHVRTITATYSFDIINTNIIKTVNWNGKADNYQIVPDAYYISQATVTDFDDNTATFTNSSGIGADSTYPSSIMDITKSRLFRSYYYKSDYNSPDPLKINLGYYYGDYNTSNYLTENPVTSTGNYSDTTLSNLVIRKTDYISTSAATHTFTITKDSDGKAWMWIDGTQVYNSNAGLFSTDLSLSAGLHEVSIEYAKGTANTPITLIPKIDGNEFIYVIPVSGGTLTLFAHDFNGSGIGTIKYSIDNGGSYLTYNASINITNVSIIYVCSQDNTINNEPCKGYSSSFTAVTPNPQIITGSGSGTLPINASDSNFPQFQYILLNITAAVQLLQNFATYSNGSFSGGGGLSGWYGGWQCCNYGSYTYDYFDRPIYYSTGDLYYPVIYNLNVIQFNTDYGVEIRTRNVNNEVFDLFSLDAYPYPYEQKTIREGYDFLKWQPFGVFRADVTKGAADNYESLTYAQAIYAPNLTLLPIQTNYNLTDTLQFTTTIQPWVDSDSSTTEIDGVQVIIYSPANPYNGEPAKLLKVCTIGTVTMNGGSWSCNYTTDLYIDLVGTYGVTLWMPTIGGVIAQNTTEVGYGDIDPSLYNQIKLAQYAIVFDPSGYVKDQNDGAVYNAKVQLSNGSWSDPCTGNCFSDPLGHWNTNIYANGTYNYIVSKQGFATISSSQNFTIGGINNNFTLTSVTGRIYGTVYEFSNVSGTKAVQGELQTLKTLSRPLICSVGSTCALDGGYVIKIHDMDTVAQIALIDIYKDGTNILPDNLIYPNQKYKYKVSESSSSITYIVVDVGTMFDNGEIQTVQLQAGFQDDKKTGFGLAGFLFYLSQGHGSPSLLQTLSNLLAWLLYSPAKTTDEAVTFNTTNQNVISSTIFDFVDGSYTSMFVSLDAESLTGNAGKVGFAFTDDSVDTPPNFKDIYINQRLNPPYKSDYVDFNSIDINENKKVKVWMIFYQGYSSFKVYNFYATAFCIGCQIKPLEGASIYYNFNNNTISSATGSYSLNVPLSTDLILFYKNLYESKNLTHVFNLTNPEFQYDIFLNKTGISINTTTPYIQVVPDPVVSGSPPKALYRTLGTYFQNRITICQFNQADNCIESFSVNPNTESTLDLPNYPIGTYSAYLSGSNLGIFWDIVANTNFTVIGSSPTVAWGASKYYINDTMMLNIFNPTATNNVTVYYPNGSILSITPYSAAPTLYNKTILAFGIPVGVYTASIENGNQATTTLLNIDKNNYSITVPATLPWGSILNIQYSSPGLTDLVIFDAGNNVVMSFSSIIGQGTKTWSTQTISNTAQTLTLKLVQNGEIKATATTDITACPGCGSGGNNWNTNYTSKNEDIGLTCSYWDTLVGALGNGINDAQRFEFALISIIVAMVLGYAVTRDFGLGITLGLMPYLFFLYLSVSTPCGQYMPWGSAVFIALIIGVKLKWF